MIMIEIAEEMWLQNLVFQILRILVSKSAGKKIEGVFAGKDGKIC